MRYYIIITAFLISVSTSFVIAQDQKPLLEKGDVEKFIKTLKPMSKELKSVQVDFEAHQNPNISRSLEANAKALEILEKYGWDKNFGTKWNVVYAGYIKLKMKEEMKDMPDEQRKQAMQMMNKSNKQLYPNVNEKDMELVRSNYKGLDKMMESL